jgi:hypothetical protein
MAGALAGAAATHPFGIPGLTALVAALAESLAFYAVVVARDMRARHRHGNTAAATISDLIAEFGPAEVLDTLLVRPLAMYVGTAATGNITGVVLGKVVADVAFYAVAVTGHELVRAARARSAEQLHRSREVHSDRELR